MSGFFGVFLSELRIERAARAAFKAAIDGQAEMFNLTDPEMERVCREIDQWQNQPSNIRAHWRKVARAALEA